VQRPGQSRTRGPDADLLRVSRAMARVLLWMHSAPKAPAPACPTSPGSYRDCDLAHPGSAQDPPPGADPLLHSRSTKLPFHPPNRPDCVTGPVAASSSCCGFVIHSVLLSTHGLCPPVYTPNNPLCGWQEGRLQGPGHRPPYPALRASEQP